MTKYLYAITGFGTLLILLLPQRAHGTKPDTSPRPARILENPPRVIVQVAWNCMASIDARSGQTLQQFPAEESVYRIAVTADGKLLLEAYRTGRLILWDINTGEKRWQIDSGFGFLYDVDFAADGKSFVIGGYLGTAGVFDTVSARLLREFSLPQSESVMSATLAPDGSHGALVGLCERLYTFNVLDGTLKNIGLGARWPVRFSVDGKYIACAHSQRLRVLKVQKDQLTHHDVGEFDDIRKIVPRKDGSFVVIGTSMLRAALGLRFFPGNEKLEKIENVPHGTGDVDPDASLAVGTSWYLRTEVTDLTTGRAILVLDNSANAAPPRFWSGEKVLLFAVLSILFILATLALVVWRRSRGRSPKGIASIYEHPR